MTKKEFADILKKLHKLAVKHKQKSAEWVLEKLRTLFDQVE